MNTKYLFNILCICLLVSLACSKGKDREEPDNGRPDTSQYSELVTAIVNNTPSITEVYGEETSVLPGGMKMTEISFQARMWNQHIFIIEVDLGEDLTIVASTPNDAPPTGGNQTIDLHALAAEKNGKTVYIGINGDVCGSYSVPSNEYKGWAGGLVSAGPFVKDGVIYRSTFAPSTTSAFAVLQDGSVDLYKKEDYLKVEDRVRDAIGCWHLLVWDGQPQEIVPVIDRKQEHPRTFLGISKDKKKVWFFLLDGRQPPYSYGLYIEDLVGIAMGTGCDRACNLDGGASTTLVVREENGSVVSFSVRNKTCGDPKEEGVVNGVRPLPNGLLVVKK